jgi:hypothetical protein
MILDLILDELDGDRCPCPIHLPNFLTGRRSTRPIAISFCEENATMTEQIRGSYYILSSFCMRRKLESPSVPRGAQIE